MITSVSNIVGTQTIFFNTNEIRRLEILECNNPKCRQRYHYFMFLRDDESEFEIHYTTWIELAKAIGMNTLIKDVPKPQLKNENEVMT